MRRICLLLSMAAMAAGAEAGKRDLFAAGEGGYKLFRIPGLVVTAKGTLLAYAEARKDDRTDWGRTDVVLRRSTDGGKSWSPTGWFRRLRRA